MGGPGADPNMITKSWKSIRWRFHDLTSQFCLWGARVMTDLLCVVGGALVLKSPGCGFNSRRFRLNFGIVGAGAS